MTSRRHLLMGLAASPILPLAWTGPFTIAISAQETLTGDVIATSDGDLTIHPIGHASLLLVWGDHAIYVDPVGEDALFTGLPPATSILITHQHPDHFNAGLVKALAGDSATIIAPDIVAQALPADLRDRTTVLANGEDAEIGDVPVGAIAAYNTTEDRKQYHPQGVGNGYVLSFGDKKVYVAGDTEDVPEMRALTGIEVAFIPMNLPYTMSVEQAADAVKAFKPRIVYPYHYRGADTEQFAALVGDAAEVRLVDWYAAG